MRALASSGRPTGPLPTCSRRVAALVLTSALLAACSESPIAPAADIPGAISKNLTATTNVGPYTITGTSSYANQAGPSGTSLYYVGFANNKRATWDDITITQGATVISENFNNGSWNTTNFEVADPLNNPGSAVGGAYYSSGCECNTPNNSRGLLRTKAQFKPTAAEPLTIEGTLTSNVSTTLLGVSAIYTQDISFLLWRSSGVYASGKSLMLNMHNWSGWTPINNFPNNAPLQQFGAGFYDGPVRIKVTDNGTNITVTFTRIPPATIQISNLPSAPSIGGSFTPQFAYPGDGITSVTSSTSAVCTVTTGVVSFLATGTCTLTASATASANYLAATGTAQDVTVGKAAATISISDIPASDVLVGGSFTPTVSYAGDGTPSVASSTSAVCTVTAGVVSFLATGTCTLTASATEGANYLATTGTAQDVTVGKAAATISISNIPASDVLVGGSFTPTYDYTGDGTRSVASSTTGVCTVTGGVVSYVGSGTCTLTAFLTEGANYLAATGSAQSFTVLPAPSTAAFTVNGGHPVQVNTPVAINGTVPSVYSLQYKIGSGAYVTGSTLSFTTTGVFQICLRLTGATNGTESCLQVPVYDPTAGFVTGGGWFTSPAAAYKLGTTLTGKAHFAFVAKYQKGANVPTGNTSFQFEVAGLSFASTSYDWLVVQGSSTSTNNTAQYKGVGKLTIGGVVQTGNYGFMLWAQDGTPDQFRIAITDPSGAMVYDNKIGSEFGTAISGGSIIVHIPKK